jgi:benzylsuccinate CoA-transferase BbsF subunit
LISTSRILEGVRVLAFTTGYAGPYAGRLLAEYGAEVIKVESRKGGLDTFRYYGQYKDINAAPRFIECNLGVRSLAVNLKHPAGVQIIKELVGKTDAVLENFRPKVLEKFGLGDEELRRMNPQLVIVKLPGFGSVGPKSGYGTWGFNLTSFSGMTYLWNHSEQDRPIGSQGVYPDHIGFVLGPTLLVAALLRSRLTGKGVCIDLAQVEATAYMLGVTYLDTAVNGGDPEPRGNRDPIAGPHGVYRCQGEDRWCAISIRSEQEWRSFCRVIGRSDLVREARFINRAARLKHLTDLDEIVEGWTQARTAEEVMTKLQAANVPAGVVQTGADLVRDPQLRHRASFAKFADSLIGSFEIPRSAALFRGLEQELLRLPANLGSDNEQILGEILGYNQEKIAKLIEQEVLT